VTYDQQGLQPRQPAKLTGEDVAELFQLLQPELRGQFATGASAKDLTDKLALKLTTLEAELRRLRQVLTEVKANPDEQREGMDGSRHDRSLADRKSPTSVGVQRRAWFCGRAAATG
jgi:hypothetical protein